VERLGVWQLLGLLLGILIEDARQIYGSVLELEEIIHLSILLSALGR
jgi:hypothetical protein